MATLGLGGAAEDGLEMHGTADPDIIRLIQPTSTHLLRIYGGGGDDLYDYNETFPDPVVRRDRIEDFNVGDVLVLPAMPETLLGSGGTYLVKLGEIQITLVATGGAPVATLASDGWRVTLTPPPILGTAGDDVLNGTAGHDRLLGQSGNDVLKGGAGNDTLDGGLGNDALRAGEGDDTYAVTLGAGADVIDDFSGTDTLRLTAPYVAVTDQTAWRAGTDVALAYRMANGDTSRVTLRNDSVERIALFQDQHPGGDQTLTLAAGAAGGVGDDLVVGTTAADLLRAREGHDVAYGHLGNDTLDLGAGDDIGHGGDGNDCLLGGDGNDELWGERGDDQLVGGWGDDRYVYRLGDGSDTIVEKGGRDTLMITGDLDRLFEMTGHRDGASAYLSLQSDAGTAQIELRGGAEVVQIEDLDGWRPLTPRTYGLVGGLVGGRGKDMVLGTTAAETLSSGDGDDLVFGHVGNDRLELGGGNDDGRGGGGDDQLLGGDGDDQLTGGAGNDTLDGGAGSTAGDWACFDVAPAGVVANLHVNAVTVSGRTAAAGRATDGQGGTDALVGIENLRGSRFDDLLVGSAGSNEIVGGAGNDALFGGGGRARLAGGDGDDVYVFRSLGDSRGASYDVIRGFDQGDVIDVRGIDADTQAVGDQAFRFLGSAGFDGAAGALRVVASPYLMASMVEADVNGDKVVDFQISVSFNGLSELSAGNFWL